MKFEKQNGQYVLTMETTDELHKIMTAIELLLGTREENLERRGDTVNLAEYGRHIANNYEESAMYDAMEAALIEDAPENDE